MEIFQKKSRISKIARIGAWLLVGIAVFVVVEILSINDDQQRAAEEWGKLKRDCTEIWLREEARIDNLNARAKEYVEKNDLAPGDPLPPKVFFAADDDTLSALEGRMDPVQIVNNYKIATKRVATGVSVVIAVGDKVPEPGDPYSACAINANPLLITPGFRVYPRGNTAFKMIGSAAKSIEAKMEAKEKLDPAGKQSQ